MTSTPRPLRRAIGAALALAAGAVAAQPVLPPAPGASDAAAVAPADRLHACVAERAALADRKHALDARAAEHERRFAQVQAEAPALLRAKLDLDAGGADIDANEFNARAARHDAQVVDLNAQATDIQAAQDAWKADAEATNRRCAGLSSARGNLGVVRPRPSR
ncbi:MAG: hypothetical protein ACTHL8_17405 [Burkholderiaceae bacterium]